MANNAAALVLAGNGTNCERETAHACRLAGFEKVLITSTALKRLEERLT